VPQIDSDRNLQSAIAADRLVAALRRALPPSLPASHPAAKAAACDGADGTGPGPGEARLYEDVRAALGRLRKAGASGGLGRRRQAAARFVSAVEAATLYRPAGWAAQVGKRRQWAGV
jgi:hypothetical protein